MATTFSSGGQSPTSLSRTLEQVFEDAQHTGIISLSGRKFKEYPKISSKYELGDTISTDLSRNRFSEVPTQVSEYRSLEKLNCYHNVIKYLPESIVQLQNLTHLCLSRNLLTVIPPFIKQLQVLEVLIASHNKIVSLPEEIGELKRLMEIDVSCNEISHLPTQIGDLKSLRSLNIRRNLLQELPVEISKLSLRKLDFSSNKISKLPTVFRKLETLEEFVLDHNPLILPPAHVCTKGKQHIMKFLKIEAIKEDKKWGVLNESDMKRFRKSLPPPNSVSADDYKNLIDTSPENRWKRHTVLSSDSGYSTTDSLEKCGWSPSEAVTNGVMDDKLALKPGSAVREHHHGRELELQRRPMNARPPPINTAYSAENEMIQQNSLSPTTPTPEQYPPTYSPSSSNYTTHPGSSMSSNSPQSPATPVTPKIPIIDDSPPFTEDEFTRELNRQKIEYDRKKKQAEQLRREEEEKELRRRAAQKLQEEQKALLERQKEEMRLKEEARLQEARYQEEVRQREEARILEEQKLREEAQLREEQRLKEEKLREEARIIEEQRQREEAKRQAENNYSYYQSWHTSDRYSPGSPGYLPPSSPGNMSPATPGYSSSSSPGYSPGTPGYSSAYTPGTPGYSPSTPGYSPGYYPTSPGYPPVSHATGYTPPGLRYDGKTPDNYSMNHRKPIQSSQSFNKEDRATSNTNQHYRRTVSDTGKTHPSNTSAASSRTNQLKNQSSRSIPVLQRRNGSSGTVNGKSPNSPSPSPRSSTGSAGPSPASSTSSLHKSGADKSGPGAVVPRRGKVADRVASAQSSASKLSAATDRLGRPSTSTSRTSATTRAPQTAVNSVKKNHLTPVSSKPVPPPRNIKSVTVSKPFDLSVGIAQDGSISGAQRSDTVTNSTSDFVTVVSNKNSVDVVTEKSSFSGACNSSNLEQQNHLSKNSKPLQLQSGTEVEVRFASTVSPNLSQVNVYTVESKATGPAKNSLQSKNLQPSDLSKDTVERTFLVNSGSESAKGQTDSPTVTKNVTYMLQKAENKTDYCSLSVKPDGGVPDTITEKSSTLSNTRKPKSPIPNSSINKCNSQKDSSKTVPESKILSNYQPNRNNTLNVKASKQQINNKTRSPAGSNNSISTKIPEGDSKGQILSKSGSSSSLRSSGSSSSLRSVGKSSKSTVGSSLPKHNTLTSNTKSQKILKQPDNDKVPNSRSSKKKLTSEKNPDIGPSVKKSTKAPSASNESLHSGKKALSSTERGVKNKTSKCSLDSGKNICETSLSDTKHKESKSSLKESSSPTDVILVELNGFVESSQCLPAKQGQSTGLENASQSITNNRSSSLSTKGKGELSKSQLNTKNLSQTTALDKNSVIDSSVMSKEGSAKSKTNEKSSLNQSIINGGKSKQETEGRKSIKTLTNGESTTKSNKFNGNTTRQCPEPVRRTTKSPSSSCDKTNLKTSNMTSTRKNANPPVPSKKSSSNPASDVKRKVNETCDKMGEIDKFKAATVDKLSLSLNDKLSLLPDDKLSQSQGDTLSLSPADKLSQSHGDILSLSPDDKATDFSRLSRTSSRSSISSLCSVITVIESGTAPMDKVELTKNTCALGEVVNTLASNQHTLSVSMGSTGKMNSTKDTAGQNVTTLKSQQSILFQKTSTTRNLSTIGKPDRRKLKPEEELRQKQQNMKTNQQVDTNKTRGRVEDGKLRQIQKDAVNNFVSKRGGVSTPDEDKRRPGGPHSRTSNYSISSRQPSGGSTMKVIDSYKDADPNFTMRRQEERLREEAEHLDRLRRTIETKLKVTLPDNLPETLGDGVLLCQLANNIRPRSVTSIHVPSPAVPKLTMAKCRKNVENFLEACRKIGVKREQICSTQDILDERGLTRVAVTIAALVAMTSNPKASSAV